MMEELSTGRPDVIFELFTTVPEWFFAASLSAPFNYHPWRCDVGLVQRSAFEEDVDATLVALDEVDLLAEGTIVELAQRLVHLGCQAVVADIAPQGLAAGRMAGVPSILVENFTWDWIYRAYQDQYPAIKHWIGAFEAEFELCDLRIQAEPWCQRVHGAVQVGPISRRPRSGRDQTREELGIEEESPFLLVSMGGIPWSFSGLERAAEANGLTIVVPGGGPTEGRQGSLIVLPHHSRFHHPDLVHAADGVVAKLGYSTVSEVWSAGCSLGWIGRRTFPESKEMAKWVRRNLANTQISQDELIEGRWVEHLDEIITSKETPPRRDGGAFAASEAILKLCTEIPLPDSDARSGSVCKKSP